MTSIEWAPTDRHLGPHVTVLFGGDNGKYPSGNSVLVRGSDATVIVDPSLSIHDRGGAPVPVDIVHLTHVHEDHVAGVERFPQATVQAHDLDVQGIRSLDGLMSIYGMLPDAEALFRGTIVDSFHYIPRADAIGVPSDHLIELGGVTIRVVHLPGHTRGHCGLLIEPDHVFITGDIDLSTFGPYYGDAWSDLDDFEASLRIARTIDAAAYVTFHHKGVIDDRDEYHRLIDAFTAVIGSREQRMVEFMTEAPRSPVELAAHRFMYRPGVELVFVEGAERRAAELSLARLLRAGRIREVEPGRYLAA